MTDTLGTSNARRPTLADEYTATNVAWPETLPPLTRHEAAQAAHRLMLHFAGRRRVWTRRWVRRCWICLTPPFNSLSRGWRRLVHDVSHRVWRLDNPGARPHSGLHADLERRMADYVVARGWLTGSLRPAPRTPPSLDERRTAKLDHARGMLSAWERRAKIAARRVATWRRRVRAIERRLATKASADVV